MKKLVYHVNDVVACRLEIGVFEPMSIGREIPKLYSPPVFMEKLTPDSTKISLSGKVVNSTLYSQSISLTRQIINFPFFTRAKQQVF